MANRRAYARRQTDPKVEDMRRNTDEVSSSMLAEMDAALTAWEASRRAGQRRQSPPPAARGWHRQWQSKRTQPLWLLLAKAELSNAIDQGKAKRAELSTDGWQDQVLDGDKLGAVPLG